MRIILTVIEGPHQGHVFTFVGQETFVVGRSKKALFRLPKKDKYISRNHFVVEVNPPHCRLVDIGSRNGTYVNDEPVQQADLKHNDIIRIGHSVLQVRLEGAAETADDALQPLVPLDPPAEMPELEPVDDSPALTPGEEFPAPTAGSVPAPLSATATLHVPGLVAPQHPPANLPTERDMQLPQLEYFAVEPDSPLPVSAERAAEPPTSLPPKSPSELSLDALLADIPASGQPRCPLCEQPWQPGASQPRLWCDICAKAVKLLPQICPGYLLVRELDRGTTGVVYQAVREEDQLIAAVRHLAPEEAMTGKRRQRFLREMQQMRTLRHPGIVPLLDHVEADGQLFLVLEMAKGETAAEALARSGPFAVPRAVMLLCQCLEALECAHALNFLHREIKPSCILLDRHTGTEQARLMDFGLEWLCQIAHVSRYSLLKGQAETVTWMPPEQIYSVKDVTPASDVYALAATFYTLLTGRTLFSADDRIEQLLRLILEEEPTPLRLLRPDLPPPLADVLHHALAKEPQERFPNAAAFRKELEPFRRG